MKNKIRLFKTTDPIVQSLLFILFTYSLNSDIPYALVFLLLLGWQLISAVAHQFFKRTTMLRTQRKAHLIVTGIFVLAYVAISLGINEQYFEDRTGEGMIKLPIYNTILITAGMGICFWYSVICFREIRRIMKKTHGGND